MMMISPRDDAAQVEAQVRECGWKGFKVYHLLAEREDTFHAETGEFLPEWAWKIAERHKLVIMLHMVAIASTGFMEVTNCNDLSANRL